MQNSIKKWVLLTFISFVLAGCSGFTSRRHNPNALSLTANAYLQIADTSQGEARQNYLLLATRRLIQDGDAYRAQHTLNRVAATLTPSQSLERQLVQAHIYLLRKENNGAILLLNSIKADTALLTRTQAIRLHELLATLYDRKHNLIGSINERTTLDPLLNHGDAQQKNRMAIWQSLQPLNQTQLNALFNATDSNTVKGWVALASVVNTTQTPEKLIGALSRWRREYSGHIAKSLIPKRLASETLQPQYQAQQIALLVPLTGALSHEGTAIRNGFFAAYYNSKKQQVAPSIRVYDTNQGPIDTTYSKAIQHGANIIVGPLLKSRIQFLLKHHILSVPTLALNTVSWGDQTPNKQLFQFGLSPFDEATQAARKAWDRGLSRLLIFAPKNPWGQQIARFFREQWKALGGQIVSQLDYTKQPKLAEEIRDVLNVNVSNAAYHQLKHTVREKIRFIPRRRKDIDGIFLVAQPKLGRQIKPLLAYYYANDIPVFSVSNVFTGTTNPHRDRDLNGIVFCDIPWVTAPETLPPTLRTIRAHLKRTWPQSFMRHPKLYALGVDAYHVSSTLNKYLLLPNFGTPSATGILYVTPSQHLFRELPWAQFVKGVPQLLHQ